MAKDTTFIHSVIEDNVESLLRDLSRLTEAIGRQLRFQNKSNEDYALLADSLRDVANALDRVRTIRTYNERSQEVLSENNEPRS
jgi:hypothetical protein